MELDKIDIFYMSALNTKESHEGGPYRVVAEVKFEDRRDPLEVQTKQHDDLMDALDKTKEMIGKVSAGACTNMEGRVISPSHITLKLPR